MKIAYVINSVEGGGAALPVPAIAQVMRDNGAEVEVFALTRRDGRALEAMTAAGLPAHVRPGGERDHAAALAWLAARLWAAKPDLLWTSLTRATLLGQTVGAWLRKPVVSWQHAAFLKPANRVLLSAARRRSALWVADSHCVADFAHERIGAPRDRIAIWPLFGADPHAPRARPWRPGEPIRIGSLGRLHPVKGHDVLLDALAVMHAQGFRPPAPLELTIAGEGDERPRLAAQASVNGVGFLRLPGFVDRPRGFLAGLHLYVHPSRSEGLCIAAHEAMQAGLPTIVSGVGELPYSVEDGLTGLVVPPGDPTRLAEALVALLSAPAGLAPMGAAARARVLSRFSATAFAERGAAVMARIAQRRGAAADPRPRPATTAPPASRQTA
jgi:glycosyltransferase involved in cell wall biosynthesis